MVSREHSLAIVDELWCVCVCVHVRVYILYSTIALLCTKQGTALGNSSLYVQCTMNRNSRGCKQPYITQA